MKETAEALDKYLETASRLVRWAAMRRVEDEHFRLKIQQVDSVIAGSNEGVG